MSEREHSINGVVGRMFAAHRWGSTPELFSTQTWKASREWTEGKDRMRLTVELRFDDNCRNGHHTFAATAVLRENGKECAGGCLHDEIARHFPELAHLLRWHLCSTDGPMHYVANTLYFLGFTAYRDAVSLEHARSVAVWPDMPESFMAHPDDGTEARKACALVTEGTLRARLPALLAAFRTDMEACGFSWT